MDKSDPSMKNLPTAQIDTGNNSIYNKDKQTISPAKPACLSGKNTDGLLQIRVTGQQRTDWGVQAKDRRADGKHIQPLKFTEQQRQETGNCTQAHCIDKIALICQQIPHKVSKHAPATTCMLDGSF